MTASRVACIVAFCFASVYAYQDSPIAARALGYRRVVTYTLEDEPGTSLAAAGFYNDGLTEGGQHDRPSRPRRPVEQVGRKRRWLWTAS